MFFLFLLSSGLVFGQNLDRKFLNYEAGEDEVVINASDGEYRIRFYTEQIVEVSFIPAGEELDTISHAVVLKPEQITFDISEDASFLKIDSDGIDVTITKNPFQISYLYNGEEVISEKLGFAEAEEHQNLEFNLDGEEMLFGGGARALGMNRRGNRLELYNQANYGYGATADLLNYSLPVVLSSKKYLLHFDNAPKGFLDLDSEKSNTLTYETISGRKTYQLVVGDSWEEIIGNNTLLTGRQPMPPRWALGNFSSRFGYHSQQEVLETIGKFREEDIPVDAVVLDLFWFGTEITGTMGNLEFARDSFPEPEKMMATLEDQNVKTILITEPFILTTSGKWEEAVENDVLATDAKGEPYTFDFYFGNTGIIDVFKPETRVWFWNIYKGLAEMGVAGWWGDLGEPEKHPSDLIHHIGTADEVHNIYGHYWAKLIYEGYREDFPDIRPFILMRAGAAGSQRYGLIPWSGDVSRSWGGLEAQPEIALQMGLQGLGYMHSDLGGFAGDNEENELYVRWLQYGVFQPIFRPHAQEAVPSEPVFKELVTKELAKKAIELRYKLLPYNYNLAFENSRTGIPLMRPLFFEEPENRELYEISGTYFWGHDFLVSPVMESEQKEKEIYFPGDSNWFDFYSGKKFKGGSRHTVALVDEHIPTFARGGSFIPMAKTLQSTAEYISPNEIHFYYDPEVQESSNTVYHDNGETPESFEKGMYEQLLLSSAAAANEVTIEISKKEGENSSSDIEELDLIVNNLNRSVNFVWVNGIKYTGKNYMHRERLIIPIRFLQEKNTIRIEF